MNFYCKIGVPDWEQASQWGDYHFARAVGRVLTSLGHRFVIQILPEWDDPVDLDSDVTIHLMGLSQYRPKPGPLNVMWLISHPESVRLKKLRFYDMILVASASYARHLSEISRAPVYPLLQFADTSLMYPEPSPEFKSELLFVGNSRKIFRPVIRDLLPTDQDLHIWGTRWETFVSEKYIRGAYFPYEKVRQLYSSCAIVLNDHWQDMAACGFINNRIFDALACGAFVCSDEVDGLKDLLPDGLITYRGRDDLQRKISYYLSHPEERKIFADRGQALIMAGHTVEKRVAQLLRILQAKDQKKRADDRGAGAGLWPSWLRKAKNRLFRHV